MKAGSDGRLRYTPAVRSLRPWSTLIVLLIAVESSVGLLRRLDTWLDLDIGMGSFGESSDLAFPVSLAYDVTVVVVWCVWQHAAATNLARRSPGAQRHSPSSGVWSWFIPFVNFVRPVVVMLDLWRGSEALVPSEGPRRPASGGGVVMIALWWAAYLAPFIVVLLMFAFLRSALPGSSVWIAASVGLPLVRAVLACVIVHRITRMQDAWLPGDADADPL